MSKRMWIWAIAVLLTVAVIWIGAGVIDHLSQKPPATYTGPGPTDVLP